MGKLAKLFQSRAVCYLSQWMLCLSPITQRIEDKLAALIFPVCFGVAFISLPFVIVSHTHERSVTGPVAAPALQFRLPVCTG